MQPITQNQRGIIGIKRDLISVLLCATIVVLQLLSVSGISYSKLDNGNEEVNFKPAWPRMRSNAVRDMLGRFRMKPYSDPGVNDQDLNPLEPDMDLRPTDTSSGKLRVSHKNLAITELSGQAGSPGLDKHGRVQMGVASDNCDDAKTNLTLDWDLSPVNYTCFHPETRFPIGSPQPPLMECTTLPKEYMPQHFCMDEHITYEDNIPSYGDHRPLWPVFGEYLFVPRERWLHNIEHGAVVMLYHPCAHPMEVASLKKVVQECIGKHVITPSTFVPPDRPLALVAWGCRLLMSLFDEALAVSFIEKRGLHGPEGSYTKEGQYTFGLIKPANDTETARYDRITCRSSGTGSM